jgi:hypothetical protein
MKTPKLRHYLVLYIFAIICTLLTGCTEQIEETCAYEGYAKIIAYLEAVNSYSFLQIYVASMAISVFRKVFFI